jgi:hypothetical protein
MALEALRLYIKEGTAQMLVSKCGRDHQRSKMSVHGFKFGEILVTLTAALKTEDGGRNDDGKLRQAPDVRPHASIPPARSRKPWFKISNNHETT